MLVCVCEKVNISHFSPATHTRDLFWYSKHIHITLSLHEWVNYSRKNNIDDCWVSTQALNRIELNCRNFPFPSFCCRRHRLSLSLSIPKHSRHDDEWGKLSWFTSFHSHRFASALSTENRSLSLPHPPTAGISRWIQVPHRASLMLLLPWQQQEAKDEVGKISNIAHHTDAAVLCCHGSIKVDDDFQPSDLQSSERWWWKFSLFVGNNAKVKRISQLEKTPSLATLRRFDAL